MDNTSEVSDRLFAATAAGPIVMLLPETTGVDLPDTLEEAEALWHKKGKTNKVATVTTTLL